MTSNSLPVIDPDALTTPRTERTVHGVVLAAGTSTRFGEANKLLEPVDGEPLVRRAVTSITRSVVDETIVVVGHEADRVREALGGLSITSLANEDYAGGQATSVRTGVRAAREAGTDAVVIALGDMPHVSTATVDVLVECYERGVAGALAAAFDGQRGNPVLFDARYFDALESVEGDVGGRDVLTSSNDAALIETTDPGVLADIDRQSDLSTR